MFSKINKRTPTFILDSRVGAYVVHLRFFIATIATIKHIVDGQGKQHTVSKNQSVVQKKCLRIDLDFREFSFRNQDVKIVGQNSNLICCNYLSHICFIIQKKNMLNPIPTGHGRNQPIYERHMTKSGRNRVKYVCLEAL